ncbi:MAG TPA: acyl carrier protein [Mycobacteriales bacterium]|nr:acyl carrier protein [Mycobacteriales bacterium]
MARLTLDTLVRIMRESAGEEEGVDLDGDILDTLFIDLGYDSLALLQTTGRIERDFGIELDDYVLAEAETPRALLELVNADLDELVA